jgi:hypothetical protein
MKTHSIVGLFAMLNIKEAQYNDTQRNGLICNTNRK